MTINKWKDRQSGMAIIARPDKNRQTLLINNADIRILQKYVPLKRSVNKPKINRPSTLEMPTVDNNQAALFPSTKYNIKILNIQYNNHVLTFQFSGEPCNVYIWYVIS